ncbi:MAG: hypothetical protein ACI8PW_000193, partial [Methylophilaceae bacterium]
MIKKFLNKVFKKREHAINAINQAESTLPSMAKVISAKKHKI